METCFVCEGKSGNVVVVMGTSVSEVNDSSDGERLIWDYSLVIFLCLAPHLLESASCLNIRGVDRQAEQVFYSVTSAKMYKLNMTDFNGVLQQINHQILMQNLCTFLSISYLSGTAL